LFPVTIEGNADLTPLLLLVFIAVELDCCCMGEELVVGCDVGATLVGGGREGRESGGRKDGVVSHYY